MSVYSEIYNEQEGCLTVLQATSQDSLSFLECPTSAKVSLAALTVIGIALPIAGVISCDPFLFAFSIAGAALSLLAASRIIDYEDPLELQRMREQAPRLSWTELTNKHDLYRLPLLLSQGEIMAKFEVNYQGGLFSDIVYSYPLATIEKYQLATFSQNSFLKTCFLREMKQFPLSTLRSWYWQGWGLGDFPYREILQSKQMDALLNIRTNLINADNKKSREFADLNYQFPYRMDVWVQELNCKELDISWKVSEHGQQVEDSVKRAYQKEIVLAETVSEKRAIQSERDTVARDARKEAESIERARLQSEFLWEKWDPIRRTLANVEQALHDTGAEAIREEHAFQEALCIKYVLEVT